MKVNINNILIKLNPNYMNLYSKVKISYSNYKFIKKNSKTIY